MTNNPIDSAFIPMTSSAHGEGREVRPDLYCFTIQIVNIVMAGTPGQPTGWVLVDAGMPRSADMIAAAAAQRFGANVPPRAIILTHGHFDHVGAAVELASRWNVPVYAHPEEIPYLTGKLSYPEPDPTVEGGMVAKMSGLFPNDPVDLGGFIRTLPADGSIPVLPGWRWIYTPGHSPGHVSLFREQDRSLIAGDAFVTVKQDYLYQALTQKVELYGPPRYFTIDWVKAKDSVKRLAALQPAAAVTGHGLPVAGKLLKNGLDYLAREFDSIAVPDYGRYVHSRE